jgi:hypothetical protein
MTPNMFPGKIITHWFRDELVRDFHRVHALDKGRNLRKTRDAIWSWAEELYGPPLILPSGTTGLHKIGNPDAIWSWLKYGYAEIYVPEVAIVFAFKHENDALNFKMNWG